LRGPFIIPLGYNNFGTPLDAICGSYPEGYLTNPFRISLSPSWISLKHSIFDIFFKNPLSYLLGKTKTPSSSIGYPDSSITQ
jgi:hypothetical protein